MTDTIEKKNKSKAVSLLSIVSFAYKALLVVFLFLGSQSAYSQISIGVGYSKMIYSGGECAHVFNYSAPLAILGPYNVAAEVSSLRNNPPANVYTSTCTPVVATWDYCVTHPDPDCTATARGVYNSCPGWAFGPGLWGCAINVGSNSPASACGTWNDSGPCAFNGGWSGSVPNAEWSSVNTTYYEGWYSSYLYNIVNGLGCGNFYINVQHNYSGNYPSGGQAVVGGCW